MLLIRSLLARLFITFLLLTAVSIQIAHSAPKQPDCLGALEAILKKSRAFDELIKLQVQCPESPEVLHNLAVSHANQKNWDSAIALFRKAIKVQSLANASYKDLLKIHQYQAQIAYHNALNLKTKKPSIPIFNRKRPQKNELDTKALDKKIKPVLLSWYKDKEQKNDELPDYLIEAAGNDVIVLIRDEKNTYSLRLTEKPSWQITKEQKLP